MKITIKRNEYKDSYRKEINIWAENEDGKEIFGSYVTISKKKLLSGEWSEWNIIYSSGDSGTYEEKLPLVATINEGMKILKELNNK